MNSWVKYWKTNNIGFAKLASIALVGKLKFNLFNDLKGAGNTTRNYSYVLGIIQIILKRLTNIAEKTIIIAYRLQQLLLTDYLRISKDLFMII